MSVIPETPRDSGGLSPHAGADPGEGAPGALLPKIGINMIFVCVKYANCSTFGACSFVWF
jgi:hypothetical protein